MFKAVENTEYRAMLGRMVRAYGRRVASGDPEDLIELADLVREAEAVLHSAALVQNGNGVSWARIGTALGVTRSAAFQRFARAD